MTPVERYVRCSVTRGDWTIDPGIEWREGDDFDALADQLVELAGMLGDSMTRGAPCPIEAGMALEGSFRHYWPGRAFFFEVHDAKCERWTQVFQPYGMPRRR